jgi:hypothetical protein
VLTNLYYFGLYKPYIVGNSDASAPFEKRARIAERRKAEPVEPQPTGRHYILNKSLKDEIIRYAHDVSYGVTGVRTAVYELIRDIEDFDKHAFKNGYAGALGDVIDDLETIKDAYNRGRGFMREQKHSAGLRVFSYEMDDRINHNAERLRLLGISLDEREGMRFDPAQLKRMNPEGARAAMVVNLPIFDGLNRSATEVLSQPLAQHMRFKALGYHYNYRMGRLEEDGFGIIESGLIYNKAV